MSYSKYRANKTEVDGIVFDSKREAARYRELKLMEQTGEIFDLKLQPTFELQKSFKHKGKTIRAITYKADFMYRARGITTFVVEDVKGMETEVFKIKRKMFLKQYGDEYNFVTIK